MLRVKFDEINLMDQSAASCIDFLWRTSSTWALCSIGWSLNLGLQSTSNQDSLHASMRTSLSGKSAQLHRMVDFLRDVVESWK